MFTPGENLKLMKKPLGILISYMGKGKVFGLDFFLQNDIVRNNCKICLLREQFPPKNEDPVSKESRDIRLEKIT